MTVSAPGEEPGDPSVFNTLIFGTQQASLQCQSTYNYDKYLYYKNHFFGMKNEGEYNGTFELGIGNQINGEDMLCYVSGLSDAVIIADKEFIRIRVNSNSKPEKIFFYKSFSDYKADIFELTKQLKTRLRVLYQLINLLNIRYCLLQNFFKIRCIGYITNLPC
jgi:hypothetical protein